MNRTARDRRLAYLSRANPDTTSSAPFPVAFGAASASPLGPSPQVVGPRAPHRLGRVNRSAPRVRIRVAGFLPSDLGGSYRSDFTPFRAPRPRQVKIVRVSPPSPPPAPRPAPDFYTPMTDCGRSREESLIDCPDRLTPAMNRLLTSGVRGGTPSAKALFTKALRRAS